MEAIPLSALLGADFNPAEYKLHCAVYNGQAYPIEVLVNDPERWKGWNSWSNVNDDFNGTYIFSLAQDRQDPSLWLFDGIWEVVGRRPEPRAESYEVVLREDLMGPFVLDAGRGVRWRRTKPPSEHGTTRFRVMTESTPGSGRGGDT
jgi:hypothetical protein